MQARRAARELAFILFSQFDKKITNYSRDDLQNIILKSVRILTGSATDELKTALASLIAMRDQIENYEADSEINLKRPIGAANIPVPLPMTSDMTGRINEMIDIAEKSLLALEIAEFTTLDAQNDVKNYAIQIAEYFQKNHVCPRGYRTPNQRELMLMYTSLTDENPNGYWMDWSGNYMTYTGFSFNGNSLYNKGDRPGFLYAGDNLMLITDNGSSTHTGRVRCVRDVTN